ARPGVHPRAPRHVRRRDLGPAPAPADARARPGRQEAAVLFAAWPQAQLRVGARRAAAGPGDPPRARLPGARRLSRLPLRTVAAVAETSPSPVKTFSIGFDGELNELPLARRVAQHFGTDHRELMVTPDAVNMVPKIVRHYGEPFADATAIPTFYLAEMARRHVTVALNGDGGDETFGGYTRYVAQVAAARAGALPG